MATKPSVFMSRSLADGAAQFCGCARADPGLIAECLEKPPSSQWVFSSTRRAIDIILSGMILLVGALPMFCIAACVRLTSKGGALFSQERVGLNGQLFRIYKFRSMTVSSRPEAGPGLTQQGDNRITPLGRWLRKSKLDELPQFYNVLRGDMSLVGPRPKLAPQEFFLNMPYRPGITGPATVAFRDEENLLRQCAPYDMEKFYEENIKPLKARIDVCYMCRATPASDVAMVAATLLSCLAPSATNGGEADPTIKVPAATLPQNQ